MTLTDIFHNPQRYGDMQSWRNEVVALHEQGPIHRIEAEGFSPFWAVIGHDAVMQVERQPALFTNEPVPVLAPEVVLQNPAPGGQIRTLIHMDRPDHTEYRRLTNDWFRPANIAAMQDRLDGLSREAVAKLEAAVNGGSSGTIDFNNEVAVPYPLQVILSILGLPESDYPRMLQLTQELFGAQDPDLQREAGTPEETAAVIMDFYQYFTGLTADRQANPTDDLATLIANGEVYDAPMPELEKMGYYVIVATAGHDTTSASMSEGMAQLASNPDQLQLLRERPELLNNAVEEMIRMAASVRHFMRTATEDTEVAGQPIAKGDWLMLNYAAANLDPGYFTDPLTFDITRANADKQISFGFGIHFCLGAQLARQELRSLFAHLVPRLASADISGEATTGKGTFVSGYKALPLRYELTPR